MLNSYVLTWIYCPSLSCVFQCRIWFSAAGRQVPWSSTESGGSRAGWGAMSPTKVHSRTPCSWETGLKAENQEGEEEMLLVDLSLLGPCPLPSPKTSRRWGPLPSGLLYFLAKAPDWEPLNLRNRKDSRAGVAAAGPLTASLTWVSAAVCWGLHGP